MMEYYYAMGQDCLHTGQYDDAVTYFRKAARMGAPEAAEELCRIGIRFETGDGVPADEEKAHMCYEVSAEFDEAEALFRLANIYLRGFRGARPNTRKARIFLERASDAGDRESAALLGKIHDEGICGKVDTAKAFQYYLLAAERGDTDSMLMTGLFYAQGDSVPKDLQEAESWIRKGASAHTPDGIETLRIFLSVACTEYAQSGNDEKACAMAEEAEKLGNSEVWLHLGETYFAGNGPKCDGSAFRCFEKAVLSGSAESQAALGLCYESGSGTAEDIDTAVSWYRKAAIQGNAFAMARLGYACENGLGTEKDEKEAMEWLIKAAMKGDEGATLTLKDDYEYEIK